MKRFTRYIFPSLFVMILVIGGIMTVLTGLRSIGSSVSRGYKSMDGLSLPVKAKKLIGVTESALNENFWGKDVYINGYGALQKLQGKKIIEDLDPSYTVYKLTNNQLIFKPAVVDIARFSNNVISLNEFLVEKEIPFLYVQVPYKYIRGYSSYPYHEYDPVNDYADSFVGNLKDNGIKVLNLRDLAISSDIARSGMFFNTDHHWTTRTAFWAFSEIINELNRSFGFGMDTYYTDLGNYQVDTYPKSFLGSQGRRTGPIYSGLDDYDLIYPKFPTSLDLEIQVTNEKKKGDFGNTVLKKEYIASVVQKYDIYWGVDYDKVTLTNENVQGKRILIIKDSFGRPLSAFLSLAVHQMAMIDLRHYKASIKDYILEYKPDLVMVVYNSAQTAESSDLFRFD